MSKILKVTFPENCIGCELCVFEAQKQLNKVGLNGSFVRVFKTKVDHGLEFHVEIDPQVNELDIKKIAKSCPKSVFTIEERSDEDGLIS